MKAEYRGRGMIVYTKEPADMVGEAVLRLAQKTAAGLDDDEAVAVSVLYPAWKANTPYSLGQRVVDGDGRLYRVAQGHTSQADWPVDGTPALYTPLGEVTA